MLTMKDIPRTDVDQIYKSAKKRGLRFARMNSFGNRSLTDNQMLVHQIRGSGFTCEDIIQELWLAGCEAWVVSNSNIEKERRSYILNAIDWKINGLAKMLFAKTRGAGIKHVSGPDTDMIFEGTADYDDESY